MLSNICVIKLRVQGSLVLESLNKGKGRPSKLNLKSVQTLKLHVHFFIMASVFVGVFCLSSYFCLCHLLLTFQPYFNLFIGTGHFSLMNVS